MLRLGRRTVLSIAASGPCATDAMNKEVLGVSEGGKSEIGANEILAGILLLPGTA